MKELVQGHLPGKSPNVLNPYVGGGVEEEPCLGWQEKQCCL